MVLTEAVGGFGRSDPPGPPMPEVDVGSENRCRLVVEDPSIRRARSRR
jgi:hypothetical protein